MLGKISKLVVDKMEPGTLIWDRQLCGWGVRRQLRHPYFVLRYRVDGKQKLHTIGRYGLWTVEMARREAQRLLGIVATGVDVAANGTSGQESDTFAAFAERFLTRQQARLKPRSYEDVERYLRNHAAPLHPRPLISIARRDVAEVLGRVETECGPVARNRFRSALSALFAWCITEGLIENSPVAGTAKAEESGGRERVLSEAEIRAVWAALGEDDYSRIVRLLLLTGQRRNEIALLDWREVVGDAIMLPAERCKNGRSHQLPLSKQAKAILEATHSEVPDRSGGRVFATVTWSRAKTALDARAGIAEWRLHDLRRTAASGMQRLGVRVEVIERALNHVSGSFRGVAGIYQRDPMTDDVREALQRWADHLDQITKN
jgi:integrase